MTEQELADRFSAALTEIGEASAALVFAEREACAKILDDMAKGLAYRDEVWVHLTEAAKVIRNRPR